MAAGVATGRTVDDWQMPKGSQSGDLVIWYAAGHRKYMAGDRWMPTSIPRLPGTYCWPRQSRTLYRSPLAAVASTQREVRGAPQASRTGKHPEIWGRPGSGVAQGSGGSSPFANHEQRLESAEPDRGSPEPLRLGLIGGGRRKPGSCRSWWPVGEREVRGYGWVAGLARRGVLLVVMSVWGLVPARSWSSSSRQASAWCSARSARARRSARISSRSRAASARKLASIFSASVRIRPDSARAASAAARAAGFLLR